MTLPGPEGWEPCTASLGLVNVATCRGAPEPWAAQPGWSCEDQRDQRHKEEAGWLAQEPGAESISGNPGANSRQRGLLSPAQPPAPADKIEVELKLNAQKDP